MSYIIKNVKKEGLRISLLLIMIIFIMLLAVSAVSEKSLAHTEIKNGTCNELEKVIMVSAAAWAIEIEESGEKAVYYDVPLSSKTQDQIRQICEGYGIDMDLILAMIKYESGFDGNVVGDNQNSFGLMQIQPRWHRSRMEKLGVTDLMDPCQNVTVGADIMAQLLSRGKGTEWALMAYNGGEAFADYNMANKTVSQYVHTVLEYREKIRESAK